MAIIDGSSGADLLQGTAGADRITGLAGDDTLLGIGGDDTLRAGTGTDSVEGGTGRDLLHAALSAGDWLDGGDGFDRLLAPDFSWVDGAVRISVGSLLNTTAGDTWIAGFEAIAGATFGSFDDVCEAGFAAEAFTIAFSGGVGTDLLALDYSGRDAGGRLAGSLRLDAAATGAAFAELQVTLGNGTVLAPVRIGTDIERLDITAGAGADTLAAGVGTDTLRGGAGDDVLSGLGGDDLLEGGVGADTLRGGWGADVLLGGGGADRLEGGGGPAVDLAIYFRSPAGVQLDLLAGTGSGGDAAGDVLRGIEGLVGSGYDDLLRGDDGANVLYGGYGADTLEGMGGDDFLMMGQHPRWALTVTLSAGLSVLDGGDGNDEIWGEGLGGLQPAELRGGAGDDRLYYGLRVDAGEGNDYVYGGSADSTIEGGPGNDDIEATYGSHTVHGGLGSDFVWTEALHGGSQTVWLGRGDDIGAVFSYDEQFAHRFDGGAGTDTFYFSYQDMVSFTARVALDLQRPDADGWFAVANSRITGFERVVLLLGGEHDDVLRLGELADVADAAEGDDLLQGRGGEDLLKGGYGADTVRGGQGADVVIGGSSPAGRPDLVHGEAGDDVVYGNFSSADFTGRADLWGDGGADVFVFLPTGIYTPDRVMDYEEGVDRIALFCGPYWDVDPAARAFVPVDAVVAIDTAAELLFRYHGPFGEYGVTDIDVRYDRAGGTLAVRDANAVSPDWIDVCVLRDAPALTVEDFLTIAVPDGGAGAAYYGLPGLPELLAAAPVPELPDLL